MKPDELSKLQLKRELAYVVSSSLSNWLLGIVACVGIMTVVLVFSFSMSDLTSITIPMSVFVIALTFFGALIPVGVLVGIGILLSERWVQKIDREIDVLLERRNRLKGLRHELRETS